MAEGYQASFSELLKTKESENYYEILGCDELNTKEQINVEYKKKALKYHPDKNSEDQEMFERLQKAREVLCDDAKRKSYDTWRRSGIKDLISFDGWLRTNAQSHLHWAQPPKKKMLTESNSSLSTNKGQDHITTPCRTGWGSRGGLKWKFQNYEI